jgi:hypothetical protein
MSFRTDSTSEESTRQWIETNGGTLVSLDKLLGMEDQDDEEAGFAIPDVAETAPETAALQPTVLETPLETTPLQTTDLETTPLEITPLETTALDATPLHTTPLQR